MPLRAVISDIHGNLAALEAVLDDIEKQKMSEIYCLGDTIGYGPHPAECLSLVRQKCRVVLMGNHEYAAVNKTQGFNPVAEQALDWTRAELAARFGTEVFDYLRNLKAVQIEGNVLHVHGSIKDPIMDYVREVDSYASFRGLVETIRRDFREFDICFTGHNHRAFLGTEDAFIYPHEIVHRFHVKGAKLYVCVGSVGQPRDGDPRACYVIYDGEWVDYRRVEYDIKATAEAIRRAGLHSFLAERLFAGE